jgi:hypothetical protein
MRKQSKRESANVVLITFARHGGRKLESFPSFLLHNTHSEVP